MNFRYTIFYVEDVAKTIRFYEDAFGLTKKMVHESGDYGEMDTGTTRLSFSSIKLMECLGKEVSLPKKNSPSFEIAFETDDVAGALMRATDAGADLVQKAEDMPWGQTTAYVNDINGFLVEICSPIKS